MPMDLFGKDRESTATKIAPPFASNTEDEKEELSQKLEMYKEKLSSQWTDMKDDAISTGKNAAVIGGVVIGVYALMETILPKATDDKKKVTLPTPKKIKSVAATPSKNKQAGLDIAGAVQGILWAAAMAWAKKKVTEFVVAERKSDVKSNE